jgi:hypothetical protein
MMKASRFVGMALAVAALAGCSDGPLGPRLVGLGVFDGTWDGAEWRGSAVAILQHDSLTVIGTRRHPVYYQDEYIKAQVRFTGPGTYAIPESQGELGMIVGGDAGYMPKSAGTLVIDGYDATEQTVSGYVTLRAGSRQPAWEVSGRFAAPVYPSFEAVPQQ